MKRLVMVMVLLVATQAQAVVLCSPRIGGAIWVRPEKCKRHETVQDPNPPHVSGWLCARFERLDKPFGSLVRFKYGCGYQEQSLNASDQTCYPKRLGTGRLLKARDATSGGCELSKEVQFWRGQCTDDEGTCS